MKKTYIYDGPVSRFGMIIDKRYLAITTAVSEKAARNNLCYRYKMSKGLKRNAMIFLPGEIKTVS